MRATRTRNQRAARAARMSGLEATQLAGKYLNVTGSGRVAHNEEL
jgi:hypothetical protein